MEVEVDLTNTDDLMIQHQNCELKAQSPVETGWNVSVAAATAACEEARAAVAAAVEMGMSIDD